jgi:hypothetical protein
MKDYVLNKKPEPASNEMVWAFDLGKGSIGDFPSPRWGEGGRSPDEVNKNFHHEFLHKASLPWRDEVKRRRLIPAEFAETKTAAGRRRMWRTRQAHGSPGFAVARLTARRNSLVNNLDHPCSFDQLILRVQNQNATQTQAALPPKDTQN